MSTNDAETADAVVVGGGFYGCVIASYLSKVRRFKKVIVFEQECSLLQRASLNNQARIHNGYHYPRNFLTALRSRENYPQFLHDWPLCVNRKFTKLYAIARSKSKVNAAQFQRFCRLIRADLKPAPPHLERLFSLKLIEQVFIAEETAFDSTVLAAWASKTLKEANISVRLNHIVSGIYREPNHLPQQLSIHVLDAKRNSRWIKTQFLFNCTYSGINHLGGEMSPINLKLKHELTEIAYVKVPDALEGLGITVMDGPFFSVMPFPPRKLHSLSHVRYTPRSSWIDNGGDHPYAKLESHINTTRAGHMFRDVSRYLPIFSNSSYCGSSFEVKTILEENEGDDGRPIVCESHENLPGCFSILGSKIDNIYDVLHFLDSTTLKIGRQ